MKLSLDRKSLFRKKRNKNLSSLLLGVLLAMLLPAATYAADTVQGVIRVVNPQADDESFYYELAPGDTLEDKFWLVNFGTVQNEFHVYVAHRLINEKGQPYFSAEDDGKKDVSEWITLDEANYTVKAEKQSQFGLTITIPEDASLGTYEGAFALERKNSDISQEGILHQKFRIAVPIKINVTENPAKFIKASTFSLRVTNIFWVAAVIFLLSLLLYIRGNRKKPNS